MKALNVGIIGLGWWGGTLANSCVKSGINVVTGWSPSEATRNRFQEEHGITTVSSLDEVIAKDEVEAVLLATPHSTHADQIVLFAEAGRHIFVEKPLTLTVGEGRRAVSAARKAGVILQVGHWRRRVPALRELNRLRESGELGIVHYAEANRSYPNGLTPRTGWRADPSESPAGGMTGLGVHLADSLYYLLGPAKRVTAVSKQIIAVGPLDDVTSALIEYESGPLATLTTSMVVPDVARTALHGTKATAWIERDGDILCVQGVGERSPEVTEYPRELLDPVADQLAEFARCIREGIDPEVTGEVALESVAILEAITLSSAGAGWIGIDSLRLS